MSNIYFSILRKDIYTLDLDNTQYQRFVGSTYAIQVNILKIPKTSPYL